MAQGICSRLFPRATLRVSRFLAVHLHSAEFNFLERLTLRFGYRFGVPNGLPLSSRADYLEYWQSDAPLQSVTTLFWYRYGFLFSIAVGIALLSFGLVQLL